MAEVTEGRFCPVCEQIVPREQIGVPIKVSPSRTILLHEGCAEGIFQAYGKKISIKKQG